MNTLPQFKLTASILLSNLRLKNKDPLSLPSQNLPVPISEHGKIEKSTAKKLSAIFTLQTDSKNPMLGDRDSEHTSPKNETVIAFESKSPLKHFSPDSDDKMNQSLGKVKINRVMPSIVVDVYSPGTRKDSTPDFNPLMMPCKAPLSKKEGDLGSPLFTTSKVTTPMKSERSPAEQQRSPLGPGEQQRSQTERNSPTEKKSTPSSLSELAVANERNSQENKIPDEREQPIMILKEYLDGSDWGGLKAPGRVAQEQKIVEMNILGFKRQIRKPGRKYLIEEKAQN